MNYSKQREKILDVLTNNAVHPTAETLLELLKAKRQELIRVETHHLPSLQLKAKP